MNYATLENDIAARLAILAGVADIETATENEVQFDNQPFAKPRITVRFMSSNFSDSTTKGLPEVLITGATAIEEFADVHIILRCRTLRGSDGDAGAYQLIASVRSRLTGWPPPNWHRMHPSDILLLENEDGIFTWDFIFKVRTVTVQAHADEADGALVTAINFVPPAEP